MLYASRESKLAKASISPVDEGATLDMDTRQAPVSPRFQANGYSE